MTGNGNGHVQMMPPLEDGENVCCDDEYAVLVVIVDADVALSKCFESREGLVLMLQK